MMDVQPEGIDLSSVTESTVSTQMAASASAASAALLGATPMGLDGDSAQFAAALNAAGGYAFSPSDEGGYTLARGMVSQPVASDALVTSVLKMCSK